MSRISILDQWKFHNGTNFRLQQLRQNQLTPSIVKQMVASERSQSTGQHMKRPFLSIPATSGGFPRNYDEAINDMEYGIELENVLAEQDQLKGTDEPQRVPFDFKLSKSVKSELIKAINKLIKESQYIFSGEIDTIKYVNIFKEFNNMSFTYNEYVDDIKQDAEFLQLWHTKLANLDSIFIKVKQRLHDLSNGLNFDNNILVVTGAYQTDYIIGILSQLIDVINMMMLNKNTTQYLAVENKPLTEITHGQVESAPQHADPDEEEEYDDEEEEGDEEDEEEDEDEEEEEEEGESEEEKRERELREFEEEERKRREADEEARRQFEEDERKRIEREEDEARRKADADEKRRRISIILEDNKRKVELLKKEMKVNEDGEPEKLLELQAEYVDIMSSNFVLQSELEELHALDEGAHNEEDGVDEEKEEESPPEKTPEKSPEAVPEVPLTESQQLNKNYYARVYTTDRQYLEYVRDKLAPFIYKNKVPPSVKEDAGKYISTKKLRQFPSSTSKGAPINTTYYKDYLDKLKSMPDVMKVNPITKDMIGGYYRKYSETVTFAENFIPRAEAALL